MPRTVRRAGKTARVRPIRDERDGRARGFTVESSDGRTGVVVRPDPVRMKLSMSKDGR